MEYRQAVAWVHGLRRLASSGQVSPEGAPGLQRMQNLLAALGNPQRKLRVIHVAGTNGKGSTVILLASILEQAGYRVGATISPYIVDFRERFLLNGVMVPEERLAELLTEVRAAARTLAEPPIEFEAVTAAALLYFAQENCDLVCLEAGIGGRLDATNVVENTLVACITQIGFDHTEILGDTASAIAREKCGILKNRCPLVCYPAQPKEAAAEIVRCAKQAGSELVVPALEDFRFYKGVYDGSGFSNRFAYGGYELSLALPGRHQALNASVALEAALALWRQGYAIEDEHIVRGIAAARFPGRIELVRRTPPTIIDGAHNVDSAKALARTLRAAGLSGLTAIAGVLRDKQAEEILELVLPFVDTLYTVTPGTPRALPAAELAALAAPHVERVQSCKSVKEARALALAAPGQGILVFGSMYLAAEARALFLE